MQDDTRADQRPGFTRARWAAVGAVLAISLGAGGLGIARATSPSGASAFVPITPCRLADTRPGERNVGGKTTPLGAGDTLTLNGWGARGLCTDAAALPTGTTGLQLNVTALNATTATFLTLFPTGAARPTASNLNPTPGQPPTPNAVTVALAGDGQFNVFNAFGTVDVIVDVVGYYTDHDHDDRYYTKAESDAALAGLPDVYATHLVNGDAQPDQTTPGILSATTTGTGIYEVTLDRDPTNCVPVANVFGGPDYYVYTYVDNGRIYIYTYRGMTLISSTLHLVVVCSPD